jgi:uncharacterized protein (TIGR03437 family)
LFRPNSLFRPWFVLAALAVRLASGQAPAYSSSGIVNGANFTPGPLAPNSVVSIFGSNLSFGTASLPSNDVSGLPLELADVEVYVTDVTSPDGGYRMPLFYVSPTQINFLLPSNLLPGATMTIYVARQGVRGPNEDIKLVTAAPQLFETSDSGVIAQHADYSFITPQSPAVPGEIVIVYATGLGTTEPNADPSGAVPEYAAQITTPLQVLLNGTALDTDLVKYAGATPGSDGVYQVNVQMPQNLPSNPAIQLAAAGQTSTKGVILPTQPSGN